MRLIGLAGYKQAGKDQTFAAIKAALPHLKVEHVAIGDKVKELCGLGFAIYDDPIGELNHYKTDGFFEVTYPTASVDPIYSLTIRQYIQNLGAAARKMFGENFWIDQVLPDVPWRFLQPFVGTPDVLVVTDVRYLNEALRIIKHGGEIWRIERPGLEFDGHDSEIPLPNSVLSQVIYNDSTIDQLRQRVQEALECR